MANFIKINHMDYKMIQIVDTISSKNTRDNKDTHQRLSQLNQIMSKFCTESK